MANQFHCKNLNIYTPQNIITFLSFLTNFSHDFVQKKYTIFCVENLKLRLSTAQQHGFYETEKKRHFSFILLYYSHRWVYNEENRNTGFRFEWKLLKWKFIEDYLSAGECFRDKTDILVWLFDTVWHYVFKTV